MEIRFIMCVVPGILTATGAIASKDGGNLDDNEGARNNKSNRDEEGSVAPYSVVWGEMLYCVVRV